MLLLLADLVDFRHRRLCVLELNLDPRQPTKMEKPIIAQFDACLCAFHSNRIHHDSLPLQVAELFSNSSKVPPALLDFTGKRRLTGTALVASFENGQEDQTDRRSVRSDWSEYSTGWAKAGDWSRRKVTRSAGGAG